MSEAISLALAGCNLPLVDLLLRFATLVSEARERYIFSRTPLHLHFHLHLYYRSNSITLGIAALKVGKSPSLLNRQSSTAFC
jgi:hypothetical protein